MRTATVVAQCKINLFLRVLARESGGYHQLETLFSRLALGDRIAVRVGAGGRSLDVAGDATPPGGLGPTERNLAWRAALSYAEATGWPTGFAIEIEKRIPVGGGLGGGSADAGGVLRCLNALAPAPLPERELLWLAAGLGADVPFLTQDTTSLALAWGRGERMFALPALPPRRCALLCFPFGVPTPDAYQWLADSPAAAVTPVAYTIAQLGTWAGVDALAFNEFERVVPPKFPALAAALSEIRTGSGVPAHGVALMSGSGSTIFVLPAPDAREGDDEWKVALAGSGLAGVTIRETMTAASVEPVGLHE